MSLLNALDSGRSGLEANSENIAVIGDNIANAGTIGFKMSRADFEEQLTESILGSGGGGGGVGLGTNVMRIQQILTQGSLETTGNATDLALQGNGMFVVAGSANGVSGDFYTRDGEFTVDKGGYLVNQGGLRVQGYSADATGGIQTALGDLQLGNQTSPPSPTTSITMRANLDSAATLQTLPFSAANAAATSNFNTSVSIYDSLGNAHQATVYFSHTAAGAWSWNAVTDGSGVVGGTAGTPSVIATGTLSYDTAGKLTADTQSSTFTPIGATSPQALAFNFGTPTGGAGTGVDGITQFAGTSSATFASQDGYAAGSLTNIAIATDGTVTGTFTNGQQRAVGQVAVASFQAPDRLQRLGGNLYMATPDDNAPGALGGGVAGSTAGGVSAGFAVQSGSGDAVAGVAGTGGRASITSGALEQSNVDITTQFVDMISTQRDFEANSKTVTTADQMLSDLIQMKR